MAPGRRTASTTRGSTSRTRATRSASPNNITLDTTPPKVLSARVGKPILFAGPGRTVAIRYSFSGPAHAVVYLGRRRIIVGRKVEPQDKVKWAGTVNGKPLPAGTYVLSVGAQDIAGNETPASARKTVTVIVSYIQLAPERITARSGRRFTVHVETAARRYTWRLGHRHGARHGKVLRLRAPTHARHVPARRGRARAHHRPPSCGCARSDRARRDRRADRLHRARGPAPGPDAPEPDRRPLLRRSRQRPARGVARTDERGRARGRRRRRDRARPATRLALPARALARRVRHARVRPVPHRLPRTLASRAALRGRARRRGAPALAARRGRRPDARARHRVVAARALPSLDRVLGRLERRRALGGDRPARLLRAVHDHRASRSRACRGARHASGSSTGSSWRWPSSSPWSASTSTRRTDHLPEREAAPEQHLRGALPGQLRLLRPVDLRTLPRGRADCDRRADRPRWAIPPRRPGRAGVHGRRVARAPHLLLAVELRGVARRRLRVDRHRLALEVALSR